MYMRNVPDWVPIAMERQPEQFAQEQELKRYLADTQAQAQMYNSLMDAQSRAYVGETAADAARYAADIAANSNDWRNASTERVARISGDATVRAAQAGHKLDVLKYLIQIQAWLS